MKNKRLKKMLISSAMDIIYALLLTLVTLIFTKNILNYLYKYTASTLVWYIWDFWRTIKYTLFNGIFAYIMIFLVYISFYLLITYRRTKSLVDIIDQTEIMADGDLDRLIEVDINNDMKILADNINSISRKLKERTIEERIAQKTKNDLITNVSHDLRTPLTSIMGYLEIIDKDKYEDEVRLRYYASIAYEKAKSLSLLINDLFELTKMQNNSIKLNKSIINLVELVGQVTAYFEYQFKKADMEARINFSEDKLIVKGDGEKLVRVFENLLSNAIKYGQEGYYVDIVTRAEEDMAVVQVINYGEAIPSVDLPYIFDRFYRIEKSRNSNKGGSGLGLAITKNIVELHGGKISAYSDDDKTVFEVKLPMEE